MSQTKRTLQLPLVGTILLGLLIVLYLVAWMKRSSEPEPSSNVHKHTIETSPGEALKYWTKDRMRRAKPAKMPNVDNITPEKQQNPGPSQASDTDRS